MYLLFDVVLFICVFVVSLYSYPFLSFPGNCFLFEYDSLFVLLQPLCILLFFNIKY